MTKPATGKTEILIIEGDAMLRSTIGETLRGAGHTVAVCNNTSSRDLPELPQQPRLLIVAANSDHVMRAARTKYPTASVITLVNAPKGSGIMQRSLTAGAVASLRRCPLDMGELLPAVAAALQQQTGDRRQETAAGNLPTPNSQLPSPPRMLGASPAIERVRELIHRFAKRSAPVLIYGERGTGKELVARALHDESGRPGHFVGFNCAALPEGLLESELFGHAKGSFTGATEAREGLLEYARGGTVLLDEINAMPLGLQAKVLRFLQDHQVRRVGRNCQEAVDVRILAASNEDLSAAVLEKRFRADLFDRLDVLAIEVPTLRSRGPAEIELLWREFVRQKTGDSRQEAAGPELTKEARQAVLSYAWPGNVRELQSAVERALALGEDSTITIVADLPERVGAAISGQRSAVSQAA